MNIKDFIGKAQKGDVESFRILYEYYYSMIFKYLLRLGVPFEDVKEICNDVFLYVYYHFPSFHIEQSGEMDSVEANFKNWLYRIASRKAIDFHRRGIRGKRIPKSLITSLDAPIRTKDGMTNLHELVTGETSLPLNSLLIEKRKLLLRNLLSSLSFKERRLLVLRYFEERTYREIAKIVSPTLCSEKYLNKKATTIRKQISRICARLRDKIDQEPVLRELL